MYADPVKNIKSDGDFDEGLKRVPWIAGRSPYIFSRVFPLPSIPDSEAFFGRTKKE